MEGARLAKPAFAAVLMLGLVLVLPASLPVAGASTPVPRWWPGNHWSYWFSDWSFFPSNNTTLVIASGTWDIHVVGQADVTVGSSTYACYRVKLYSNYTTGSALYSISGDLYYRAADLARVKDQYRLVTSGPGGNVSLDVLVTDSPPLAVQWPLVTGAAWTANTTRSVTMDMSGTPSTTDVSVAYRVDANVTLTLPVGVLPTTPLNGTDVPGYSYTLQYWSSEVGFWVLQEGRTGTVQSAYTLLEYDHTIPPNAAPGARFACSPAAGNTTTTFACTSTSTDDRDPSASLRVRWDWEGDGTWDTDWSTNAGATHRFPVAGVYNVTLAVMDSGGLTSTWTQQIAVSAVPTPAGPPARLGLPLLAWAAVVVALAAVAVGLVLFLRRRKPKAPETPGATPRRPQ